MSTTNRTFVSQTVGNLSRTQKQWAVKLLSIFIVAGVWEFLGQQLGVVLFAPLSEVIPTYIDLALNGPMIPTLLGSLQEMFLGYALAVAVAVPTGLVMGRVSVVEKTIEPWVSAAFVTSTSALLPVLIIFLGIGFKLRLTVVFLACVWHILLNVYHGSKGVSEEYLDVGRSFDLPRWKMFANITLPATLPFLAAGLRMGLGRALRGIILAETYILIGYGGLIGNYGNQSISTAPVLALILTIMFLGSGLTTVLEKLQERFMPWADTDPSL